MSVPARPLTVTTVVVWDAESFGGKDGPVEAVDSVWTFSSRIVADVWVERRVLQDPTLAYSTYEVELDAGIVELPTREG